MGQANMVKYLVWFVLGMNLIGLLGGCKPEDEARKAGEHAISDSAGWARLQKEEALPPEQRYQPPVEIDISKISREWPKKVDRPASSGE